MSTNTKKICILGMFTALAFLLVAVCRVSIVAAAPFLSYEPKDVILAITGFLFGPMSALLVTVAVSFIEMVTISSSGIIGCIMNILASASFACTAAVIYKKKHTIKGAVIGLVCGCIAMTIVMVLWNYLLTPLYTAGISREMIVGMLLPIFAPFNLVKSGLNAAITMLLYKPIVTVLRKTGMVAPSEQKDSASQAKTGVIILTVVVLITFIFFALVLGGKI